MTEEEEKELELELIQIVICDGQKKQLRITLPVILNTPPLIQG